MKWITGITLENFRAFINKEHIDISFGNHLLIYGENGSGKSTIYNALKDFFYSAANPSLAFHLNYYSKLEGNLSGDIEVIISEKDPNGNIISNPPKYKYCEPQSNSNNQIGDIRAANKIKGFLDYKSLLRTHFINTKDGNPNLFDLLVNDILAPLLINRQYGGVSTYELSCEWERITENLLKYDMRYSRHNQARNELPFFDKELKEKIRPVFVLFKEYVKKYFDSKLDIDIKYVPLSFDYKKKIIKRSLCLEVKYANAVINLYHGFLNEARLTALAICIYLAAIKSYPTISDLRVIFLDDIFIGLDTNNRIPLLKMVQEEFINDGYQIFISTYDRQWFELTKHWFTAKSIPFQSLEMYVESVDNPSIPDKPVLLRPKDNLTRAEDYFKAKDYAAAGNYLRKECEDIVSNLLPETFRVNHEGKEFTELNDLMEQLGKLYKDFNIPPPQSLINSINIYRKLLLNPSSHNDLKCPFFRKEIEDAFVLVHELRNLPKIEMNLCLPKNTKLCIKFPAHNYEMEIVLAENLYKTSYNSSKGFSNARYFINKWKYGTVEYGKKENGNIVPTLPENVQKSKSEKYYLRKIFEGISKSTDIAIPSEIYSNVNIDDSGSLLDLLND